MTSARAMAARFFMPPESSAGHLVHGVLEADVFQFFRDDAFNFFRRFQPVFGQVKPDIFADGQRIEQRAGLEHQRHAVFGGDFGRLDRIRR